MATTKRKPSIIELNDEDEDLKFVRPRVSIKMINGASPYYGVDQSVITRIGNVIVGGDYSGETRGEYTIDFQILRTAVTQVASGLNSIAIGNQLTASGWNAICFGYQSQATAESSVALGVASVASGKHSLAIGDQASAINDYGISLGYLARATGIGVSVGSGADSKNDGVAIGDAAIAAIRGVAIGAAANAATDEIVFRGLHVYVQTDAVGTREELFRLSQSASITTVGTITVGVWRGTAISPTYGGTGINNGVNTLTVPASGTAALLGTAQTFTANQTINAGLNMGTATGATTGQIRASAIGSYLMIFAAYGSLPYNMSTTPINVFSSTIAIAGTITAWLQGVYVATTNNSTNYWIIEIRKADTTSLFTFCTSSAGTNPQNLAANTFSRVNVSPNVTIAVADLSLIIVATKFGLPGNLFLQGPEVWIQ